MKLDDVGNEAKGAPPASPFRKPAIIPRMFPRNPKDTDAFWLFLFKKQSADALEKFKECLRHARAEFYFIDVNTPLAWVYPDYIAAYLLSAGAMDGCKAIENLPVPILFLRGDVSMSFSPGTPGPSGT
jgi:hypothetical protein